MPLQQTLRHQHTAFQSFFRLEGGREVASFAARQRRGQISLVPVSPMAT
ncbi:hypothetical protein [Rhodococcus artemisiae]|uniref:Uncharacterized protein n=1 Tax=Rhodococcus artemisiae TaxID=714159 RepID=A0ABU7LFT4_9NOCA|nr:hypothetical protein [Rhodococcus artemisiae]MEE2060406.1 hypothetical protein [Rhodococcus artemisiae]